MKVAPFIDLMIVCNIFVIVSHIELLQSLVSFVCLDLSLCAPNHIPPHGRYLKFSPDNYTLLDVVLQGVSVMSV